MTTKKEKIYCANCCSCRVIKVNLPNNPGKFLLRVKCVKGIWQKKLGTEKLYKYFTTARRIMEDCDSYEPMGELMPFIKDLRKKLPAQDEVYSIDEKKSWLSQTPESE